MMASHVNRDLKNAQGIVVEATIDLLRKAASQVLWEYTEIEETPRDEEKAFDGSIEKGEAIIFRENIDVCPAEIVAIKLGAKNLWYIISTSRCPPEKCATARESMKCAEAEEKRLRKIKTFFEGTVGAKVAEVAKWEPDKLADAQDVLGIITNASQRYSH
jgi:hypothetical protein